MVDYYMMEWEAQGRVPQLMLIDSTGPSYDWRHQPFSSHCLHFIWHGWVMRFRDVGRIWLSRLLIGAG